MLTSLVKLRAPLISTRSFARATSSDSRLNDSFNFPKHKPFMTDNYYDDEDSMK